MWLVLLGGQGLAALVDFQQVLAKALARAGMVDWPRAQFTPHITLMYGDPIGGRIVDPIGWTVREFILVDRLRGQRRQVVLGRWPLHAV